MKSKTNQPTMTVLTICTALCGFYFLYHQKWMILAEFLIGIFSILFEFVRNGIDFLWQKLIKFLSLIVPNILLSAVFYLFLFPIALLSKLFGKKDPLLLKNPTKTTFVEVNRNYSPSNFEKLW